VLPWALPHEVGGFARGLAVRHLNAGNYVGHCRTPIPVSAILPDAWNGSSYSLWERCAPPDHKTVSRSTILRGPSGMADLPIHLDRAQRTPLAAQIYRGIRKAIETGRLISG
jgi:hypothetical protein